MRAEAIIRFIIACVISVAVIFYNGKTAFFETKITLESGQNKEKENFSFTENFSVFKPESTESESSSKTESTEQKNEGTASNQESVPTATEAVKGNVIEKYISPYTAKTSYNNVYLKNSTGTEINLKELLSANLSFKIKGDGNPEVLIMHTHTTETYLPYDKGYYPETYTSRTTDNSKNMAEIGRIISEKLNANGITTLHDTTQHDYPQYSGSYTRSAKTVNEYLKKYPSIKVVLDLHRDAVSAGGNDKTKLVTTINGKKAAQVMLVMGSQTGSVTNYPNWKENLKLALKLQQTMEVKYPTLARPLSLMSKNYNQSLTKGSLLIEFGTDANSLDEAKYSAELVGESLSELLKNLKE